MNEIKYADSDIKNGINLLKVGLNNIISYVIKNKESYIIETSISLKTLALLIQDLVNGTKLLLQEDKCIIIKVNNTIIRVYKEDNEYLFQEIYF